MSHSFYFGQVMGSIAISRLPDLYGRKYTFIASLAAQLPSYIGLILSRSMLLTTILAFIVGFCNVGIYNGAFINVCEYF